MFKIRKNDEVVVISGKYKGQSGRVVSIDRKNDKIVVDKINIVKKHNKPSQQNPDGGIIEFEAPIHISNVAFKSKSKSKDKKTTKIRIKINENGKKIRVDKSTGKEI